MPLIKINKPKSMWGALIITSMISAFIVVLAIYIKMEYDRISVQNIDTDGTVETTIQRKFSLKGAFITFMLTFLAYMAGYSIVYFLFGLSMV